MITRALSLISAVLCLLPLSGRAADRLPNFVIIFSDDQGYADVGCFGSPDIRTPRLDTMAKEGMKFTSFYAQPICGPSRAALMTGCYPHRVAEHESTKLTHPALHSKEITVAEVLKTKGYTTGCFGKWDLARHSQKSFVMDLFPTRQGFDYFFGTPTSNDSIVNLYRNEELIEPKTEMATLTQRYTDEAIGFMKKNKDKPFFVYIPHTMPHTRLAASKQFAGKSKRGLYGDVIEEIDFNAGRILDTVKELGLEKNTYVLFTSDNGPWLIKSKDHADGHLRGDHGGSAGPLRSGKVSTWEGGVRVPTILWAPGRVPAGTTCNEIASTLDVLPTFAAIAGAEPPKDRVIDGEDIRHLFRGEFDRVNPKKAYYYYLTGNLQAVRQGKWKLHLVREDDKFQGRVNNHIGPADRAGPKDPLLIDLEADLGETTNVADKNPEVVRELLALAEAMREDLGDGSHFGKNMRFFDPMPEKKPAKPAPKAKAKPKAAPKIKQGAKPNVLFIAVDDLNDWIGCMGGHPGARTPNIDRLAARGVLFEHAHCAAPICNPSRSAIMTGVRPSTSGIYANRPFFRQSPVLKEAVTLPQYFRAQGYRAMRGGKIYHHVSKTDPASWDEAFPSLRKHLPASKVKPLADGSMPKTGKWDTTPLEIDDEEMDDGQIASWAIAQLEQTHTAPFFLAVGFFHPHLPWVAPKRYYEQHPLDAVVLPKVKADDRADIPKIALTYSTNQGHDHHKRIVAAGEWEKKVQAYQASISFADAQIGRVLDALDKSPFAGNTIIVLWSDHGWHLGEKQHWTKFTLWEESARVPLIVVGPKNAATVSKGARCASPVGLIDLYPTLLELCGLPGKKGLDGRSLAPLLRNPASTWERPALTTHGRNNHTLRTERWRYTRWRTGDEELYDHLNDPMEWNNLAADPKHASVKAGLAKWFPKNNAPDAGGKAGKR